jgi:cell shape-determining protein MreC
MRYSRKNSGLSPSAVVTGLVVVVLLLVALLLRFFAPGFLPSLFAPLYALGDSIEKEDTGLAFENEELRNENAALKARLQDVGAADNIPTEDGRLGGVIARPPLTPYDVLLLSVGSDAGIREGAIVFAQGVPVGTIEEAATGFSRALLYSALGRENAGWLGEARLPVTLVGEGAGAFSARVPRELEVIEGDTVYLPGPGAFPAGVVRAIMRHPSSPSAELSIEPLVNPFTLTFVRVMP